MYTKLIIIYFSPQLNIHEVMTLKVPRHMLDSMNTEEATQFVTENPKFREFLRSWRVVGSKFHSVKGCDATIRISTEKITDELEIQQTKV